MTTALSLKSKTWRLWVAFAVALGVLGFGAKLPWRGSAIVAALAVIVVGIWFEHTLARLGPQDSTQPFWRRVPIQLMAVGFVILVVWWFTDLTKGWFFLGAGTFYFGVGQLLAELRASKRFGPLRGVVIIVLCAVAFLVTVFFGGSFSPVLAIALLAIGVLISPTGLSLLTEDVLDRLPSTDHPLVKIVLLGGGALLSVAGVLWLHGLGASWTYLLIVVGLVAVLVATIGSDTNADVIVVVVSLAIAWSLLPRTVSDVASIKPAAGDSVLVALGDSFMSGEGARNFFAGTNTGGANECRRAPTAYAPLTVEVTDDPALPHRLVFLACSGARAINLWQTPQYPNEPIGAPSHVDSTGKSVHGWDQLSNFQTINEQLKLNVRMVILSVGGNDAEFAKIAETCVGPGDCTQLGQRWLDNLNSLPAKLGEAYDHVRATFGPTIPIVVVPYPNPIRPVGCSWSALTNNEHRFLHGFTEQLDNVIKNTAESHGFYYLETMATAFESHQLRLCDASPKRVGVNFFAANPVDGQVNPANWFHDSLHPNATGHKTMRDTLVTWIDSHPNLAPIAPPPADPQPNTVASIETIMGNSSFPHCGIAGSGARFCNGSEASWTIGQSGLLLRQILVPLLILIVGTWFLVLFVLRRIRG